MSEDTEANPLPPNGVLGVAAGGIIAAMFFLLGTCSRGETVREVEVPKAVEVVKEVVKEGVPVPYLRCFVIDAQTPAGVPIKATEYICPAAVEKRFNEHKVDYDDLAKAAARVDDYPWEWGNLREAGVDTSDLSERLTTLQYALGRYKRSHAP